MSRVVGVIPARLDSTRLPRKALRPILGQPMIVWVYRRARRSPLLNHLLAATDSEEIAACCQQFDIPVQMTSSKHRSGTDRLIEVAQHEPADIYVNIQGDEPMVNENHIELLLTPFHKDYSTAVTTLKVAIAPAEAQNPHTVKVVTDAAGRALYFSRCPIPYDRDGSAQASYFKHLGFYAYRPAALEAFSRLRPGPLETSEKLEQLRFLENGIAITVAQTCEDTIGVDTAEDLQKVEELFLRHHEALPEP